MRQYVLRRVSLVFPTLLIVSLFVFAMMRFLPGDVIAQMTQGSLLAESADDLRRELGLDQPLHRQYLGWMVGLFRGDLGESLWTREPVLKEFLRRFPVTLELALLTILVSVAFGITVGVVSAIRQDTWLDYAGRTLAILLLSIPYFWLGVIVVVLPAIFWRWTPVWTWVPFTEDPVQNLKILAFPALVFGLTRAGPIMRLTRSSMLEVMRNDYIRTARAKGLRESVVVVRHALKNALIPVVSIIGIQVPLYLGGSVIIESIFRLPGVGLFFFEGLIRRDYPVVQSVNLIIASMVVLLNLAIDVSYAYLDPRIRYR